MIEQKIIVPKMWTETLKNKEICNKEFRETNMKIQYELKLLQAGYCHYLFQNNTLKSSAAYFLGGGKKKLSVQMTFL